jgi:hypothetical protein
MLRHCSKLIGHQLGASDGEIGKVEDFFFDNQNWAVRYLVADTGYWLPDRLVLISPHALQRFDEEAKTLGVRLTRQQVQDSPPIASDQPVSRQYEQEYYRYFGWPAYWAGPSLWGPGPLPLFLPALPLDIPATETPGPSADPHLRSVREMTGYRIRARDGELGHVDDTIVEDTNWAIRYLVIDTRNWLGGKKVLLAPQWIEAVSWEEASVTVDLTRSRIEQAPEYDPHSVISREYEVSLFQHYSREGYWQDEPGRDQNAA